MKWTAFLQGQNYKTVVYYKIEGQQAAENEYQDTIWAANHVGYVSCFSSNAIFSCLPWQINGTSEIWFGFVST